jgi:DNA-binding NarL/FixJ family response regulator
MKSILIIEDQPQMRRNLLTILEMEGFRVIATGDGDSGIRIAQEELPDLILCDIMMPGVDGYHVLHTLRAHKPTAPIPFIFLTAKGEKSDFRTGMNLGADDYLAKPVARADLLSAIAARFDRERLSEESLRERLASTGFRPDFSSHAPLVQSLGLTEREAEVVLWVAQGKSNVDVATILGMSDKTVKKHLGNVFEKLGVESRTAATLRAIEALHPNRPTPG